MVLRSTAAALAETLRAPLLLSPVADVASGWVLVTALTEQPVSDAQRTTVLVAAACACSLLAAGMAQNAWLDLGDDRARKPERPLPRGALSVAAVRTTWALLSLTAAGLALWRGELLPVVLGILALTAAYHLLLKRWRLAGCLALGGLRSGSMALGALAAGGAAHPEILALGCGTYGLYILGASWHAAGDDQPGARGASRAGIGLCQATLVALAAGAWWPGLAGVSWHAAAASLLAAFAIYRLVMSARLHPPPRITGVALSGLHLFHAALATALGRPLVAAMVLVLFGASRRLLRIFPPS